jgi:hypothetical protein
VALFGFQLENAGPRSSSFLICLGTLKPPRGQVPPQTIDRGLYGLGQGIRALAFLSYLGISVHSQEDTSAFKVQPYLGSLSVV